MCALCVRNPPSAAARGGSSRRFSLARHLSHMPAGGVLVLAWLNFLLCSPAHQRAPLDRDVTDRSTDRLTARFCVSICVSRVCPIRGQHSCGGRRANESLTHVSSQQQVQAKPRRRASQSIDLCKVLTAPSPPFNTPYHKQAPSRARNSTNMRPSTAAAAAGAAAASDASSTAAASRKRRARPASAAGAARALGSALLLLAAVLLPRYVQKWTG